MNEIDWMIERSIKDAQENIALWKKIIGYRWSIIDATKQELHDKLSSKERKEEYQKAKELIIKEYKTKMKDLLKKSEGDLDKFTEIKTKKDIKSLNQNLETSFTALKIKYAWWKLKEYTDFEL